MTRGIRVIWVISNLEQTLAGGAAEALLECVGRSSGTVQWASGTVEWDGRVGRSSGTVEWDG